MANGGGDGASRIDGRGNGRGNLLCALGRAEPRGRQQRRCGRLERRERAADITR